MKGYGKYWGKEDRTVFHQKRAKLKLEFLKVH